MTTDSKKKKKNSNSLFKINAIHHRTLSIVVVQNESLLLHLHQMASFPSLLAKIGGELIEGEDHKVHEAAQTAATYGSGLCRRSTYLLRIPSPLFPFLREVFGGP